MTICAAVAAAAGTGSPDRSLSSGSPPVCSSAPVAPCGRAAAPACSPRCDGSGCGGGQNVPTPDRQPLVRRRDLRQGRRPLVLRSSQCGSVWSGRRRVPVSQARHGGAPGVLPSSDHYGRRGASRGHHRPRTGVPEADRRTHPGCVAPQRAIRQQPRRSRPRPAQNAGYDRCGTYATSTPRR